MKAIIVTGGKQYTVAEGDVLYIEKLNVEAEATVKFEVLAILDGENCLDRVLFVAGTGEGQGDASILFLDPNLGLCATHIIDGGLGHGYNSRNGGADDVGAGLTVAAVSGNGESCDSVLLGEKFAFCHNYSAILVISTLV